MIDVAIDVIAIAIDVVARRVLMNIKMIILLQLTWIVPGNQSYGDGDDPADEEYINCTLELCRWI